MVDAGTIIAGVTISIGGIVWLVRLEGRVNTGEALQKALRDDITYIRGRIDDALKGHPESKR